MAIIYAHVTIITMNKARDILLDGAIITVGDKITAVVKYDAIAAVLLSNTCPQNWRVIDLEGRIVIPGLINTHAHVSQSLLRGLGEDLPLRKWFSDTIGPLEEKFQKDDGYIAARLAIAEMLRSGTTCFLESMLTHQTGFDNIAKAIHDTGIRGCLAKMVGVDEKSENKGVVTTDIFEAMLTKFVNNETQQGTTPTPAKIQEFRLNLRYQDRASEKSDLNIEDLLKAYEDHHMACRGRLRVWASLPTNRGSGLVDYIRIAEACTKLLIPITMHCAETAEDLMTLQTTYGMTPGQFCVATKLIGTTTVLAHMVHLDNLAVDLPILSSQGISVAHCPTSNLKLGLGIAPIPELLAGGVNVSLGTDGASSGNTYDMFREMHLAAILHKGNKRNVDVVGAQTVLEMATINGAKALGMDKEIGSIEVGKMADLVFINTEGLHCAPFCEYEIFEGGIDPVTLVVHSCTGHDVEMVVVNGAALVTNGALVKNEEDLIMADAREAAKEIRERASSVDISSGNWPII